MLPNRARSSNGGRMLGRGQVKALGRIELSEEISHVFMGVVGVGGKCSRKDEGTECAERVEKGGGEGGSETG